MSDLVDVVEEVGNLSQLEKDLREAVVEPVTQTVPVKQQASSDDSLPVKLRGKTREEIAEMYANLESVNGRMANDLGTQRKFTDQILGLKRDSDLSSQQPVKPKPQVKVDELLDRPTETLERFSTEREADLERRLAARLAALEGNMARTAFVQKHNDYEQISNDPAFTRWIQSSQYRMRAANAAYQGDWNAADELMSEFKERRPAVKTEEVTQPQKQQRDNVAAARAASLESSSAAASATSSKAGKIYRRSDLMQLAVSNPDKYYDEGFQKEILRAHAEGRVK